MSKEELQVKYEIGKLNKMASRDLDLTMLDNQEEADRQFGSAKRIGNDIADNYQKEIEQEDQKKRQLDANRDLFLRFLKKNRSRDQIRYGSIGDGQ